jgi:hypothetical protein
LIHLHSQVGVSANHLFLPFFPNLAMRSLAVFTTATRAKAKPIGRAVLRSLSELRFAKFVASFARGRLAETMQFS